MSSSPCESLRVMLANMKIERLLSGESKEINPLRYTTSTLYDQKVELLEGELTRCRNENKPSFMARVMPAIGPIMTGMVQLVHAMSADDDRK